MWDPLVNEFPDTVHGFRCMLSVKYLQLLSQDYSPDTLGYELIRDLICILRSRNYVEASCRYRHFYARVESTPASELRQPIHQPCCCPHCPRHKTTGMDKQAYEQEAQNVSDVQKSGCSKGL
ncbi:AV2 [Gossypium darwinii symptomless virus]|uniref:Protein V2 n=1 Tax=Gossypium darwinii symptomless virus TaxID=509531 RepID=B8Q6Q2_9GEMI|nr:movement protein [Gossypium darwinii symptomless virus]ACA96938.1 AV2 [Gossypium darwinii symptomless virus]WLD18012.1 pre-coat protein [Cotton leaf curl Multan virus]